MHRQWAKVKLGTLKKKEVFCPITSDFVLEIVQDSMHRCCVWDGEEWQMNDRSMYCWWKFQGQRSLGTLFLRSKMRKMKFWMENESEKWWEFECTGICRRVYRYSSTLTCCPCCYVLDLSLRVQRSKVKGHWVHLKKKKHQKSTKTLSTDAKSKKILAFYRDFWSKWLRHSHTHTHNSRESRYL